MSFSKRRLGTGNVSANLRAPLAVLLAMASLITSGCASRQMGRAEARRVLVNLPGINLPKDNVYVEGVTQLDGQHAVAEASLKTGFKLEKSGDQWIVSEIRLDRGRWVRIDEIYERLLENQIKRTHQEMNLVALGLERFRLYNAGYPGARDLMQLMEQIYPKYISKMVVDDAWANPLVYRLEGPTRYTITSTGPDGKLGTKDDIVMSGGEY